ncbi:MAG TPA: undecaprenyldiphospho-muramoylpentapeptide beta-N-acetylglucosaminyltransferase [bacterium]|nr:undecaprenyldiphospho-muramoylpentapeptide beta-N-acetylglucosaminyltransferase [bacterium]
MTNTALHNKLLIAGGGTGGHIFPGLAIAEEWRQQGGRVIFVGTESGKESKLVPAHGFEIRFIQVGHLKGTSLVNKMKTLWHLPRAVVTAMKIIRQEKPDVVLGIGGYVSGPTCLAAKLLGFPTAITDQNALPGFTNRLLGKIVKKIFTSFAESATYFDPVKVVCTGNPTRAKIQHTAYTRPAEVFCILIFGGSQGAVTLNKIVTTALGQLPEPRTKLKIFHQAGETDQADIETFYQQLNIRATVSRFFNNMAELYAQAHLVICRSGAGSVTELAMSGRPAIFVPYPFAADNHQKKNADVCVAANAGWCFEQKDLNADKLADLLTELFQHPDELSRRAANMLTLARPQAAKDIVTELQSLSVR